MGIRGSWSLHLLGSLLTLANLPAVETSFPTLVDVTLTDGRRWQERWSGSPYALIWRDPFLAGLRQESDRGLQLLSRILTVPVEELLGQVRGWRVVWSGFASGGPAGTSRPILQQQFELGSEAGTWFTRLRSRAGSREIKVPGADEAFTLVDERGAHQWARFKTQLVHALNRPVQRPGGVFTGDDDLRMQVDVPGLLALLPEKCRPADPLATAVRLLPGPSTDGRLGLRLTLGRDGVRERWYIVNPSENAAAKDSRTVEAKLFERLPAETLALAALAIDGPRLEEWLRLADNLSGGRILAMLGGQLPSLRGCEGTALVAVLKADPQPGLLVALPRAPAIDQYCASVTPALTAGHWRVGSDRTHWVVSTLPETVEAWVKARDPGFSRSPAGTALAKLGGPGRFVMVYDGSAILPGLIPLLAGPTTSSINAWQRLATQLRPGSVWSGDESREWRHDGAGLLGAGLLPLVTGHALLPRLVQVTQGARRQGSVTNLSAIVNQANAEFQTGRAYPLDLVAMQISQKLPLGTFSSPGQPNLVDAYRYFRPLDRSAADRQPMLIEDPACWDGRGCHVGFVDGRIAWFGGPAAQEVFRVAKGFIGSSRARQGGFLMSDWASLEPLLSVRSRLVDGPVELIPKDRTWVSPLEVTVAGPVGLVVVAPSETQWSLFVVNKPEFARLRPVLFEGQAPVWEPRYELARTKQSGIWRASVELPLGQFHVLLQNDGPAEAEVQLIIDAPAGS